MAGFLTKLHWNVFTVWHARKERGLPFRPLAEIETIQSRRVRAMVRHAYENVAFYRDAMDHRGLKPRDFQTAADLAQLPVVTKEMYAERPELFVAPNFAQADGLTLNSSGTSGASKKVRVEARALFLARANGHRQRVVFAHFIGRPFGYRELRFGRSLSTVSFVESFHQEYSWTPKRVGLTRRMVPSGDLSPEESAAVINEFQADLLVGYGSFVGALFREFRRAEHSNYSA